MAVPQLYVHFPSAGVPEPPRQLKGYRKLSLRPGESKTVTLALGERDFSYWDVATNGWRIAPGCYGIDVGSSSRRLALHGAVARADGGCG